jgi:hypothetical protein
MGNFIVMPEIPKFKYIRSNKLMSFYRTIPCQKCGIDDGTVCGAHSNQEIHGKGKGIKASDEFCASLCNNCHYCIDQGKELSREEKRLVWELAHHKTVKALTKKFGDAYLNIVKVAA